MLDAFSVQAELDLHFVANLRSQHAKVAKKQYKIKKITNTEITLYDVQEVLIHSILLVTI